MKFTVAVSSLVFLLPLLAQASPVGKFGAGSGAGAFGASSGAFGAKGGAKGGAANASVAAGGASASAAAASVAAASVAAASAAAATVVVSTSAVSGTVVASASASASTAAAAAAGADADPQTSLTLDPSVIASGFAQDGQAQAEAGQVASLTSTNNFINFCADSGLNITNGLQITTGSCNPAPMGIIAAVSNMPTSKFVFPTNGMVLQEKQPFTIQMAVENLETGNFVNPNTNYFAAPQQVNTAGNIVGHSHVVVDFLDSLTQTTPTNPQKFAFFKGLNDAAQNGVLSVDVTDGLPAGAYRLASINSAANHQPVLVAIAQHGSLDDMVYFTVQANGTAAGAAANPFASAAAASAAATDAATASAPAATAASSGATASAAAASGSAAAAPSAAAIGGLKGGKAAPAPAKSAAAKAAPPAKSAAAKAAPPAKGAKGGKRFEIKRNRL